MNRNIILYFSLACLISWLIWLPLYIEPFGIELPKLPLHHAWGAIGPAAAAFIVSTMERGREGARELLAGMARWRVPVKWYVIVLAGPFVLLLSAWLIGYFTEGASLNFSQIGTSREFPLWGAAAFFIYNVLSFGYGEETGWRGYALPRLQQRSTPFRASVILSFFWAAWHIPLFLYRPGYKGMDAAEITGWYMSLLTGSLLLTWLYNGSRRSILIVALFHATIDIVFTSKAATGNMVMYMGMLITFVTIGLVIIKWKQFFKPVNA